MYDNTCYAGVYYCSEREDRRVQSNIYLNTKLQDLLVKPLSSDLAVDKTIEVDFLSLHHSLHPIKSEYHSLSSVDF